MKELIGKRVRFSFYYREGESDAFEGIVLDAPKPDWLIINFDDHDGRKLRRPVNVRNITHVESKLGNRGWAFIH